MRHSDEVNRRVLELKSLGKSSKEIATETGVSQSGVLKMIRRHRKENADLPYFVEEAAYDIDFPGEGELEAEDQNSPEEAEDMPINENAAKSFLSDIGIKGPTASLKNDILKPSNPLKGNPKALRIAEALMGSRVARTAPDSEPPPSPTFPTQGGVRLYQPDPIEETRDAALVISQIQMNVEHFGPLLGNIMKPDEETFLKSLYSKSESELRLLLRVIEKTRLVGNMTNQLKHIFWMGSSALEISAPFVGIRAEGLTQALKTQEIEVGMILKEIALEQADAMTINQRPEMRLAFLVSTTLLSVDTMNRRRLASTASTKAANEAKETYKDL
jgi:hypothetical protein